MMEKRSFSGLTIAGWTLMALILFSTAKCHDGSWALLVQNAGISSMHTQVTCYGTVVMLDRTEAGPSNISLPDGRCRHNPVEGADDCTAHSVEFSPNWMNGTIRPLFIQTDTWCSSGQVTSNGTLVQTGGSNDGAKVVRTFDPCPPGGNCDWVESTEISLQEPRWYATNHVLEDGDTQAVIGGQFVYTWEFLPNNGLGDTTLQLLNSTDDTASDGQTDNLYPFVNLLPDGTLWIFANQDSIIYDYNQKTVVKSLPRLEGGPRNYPSSGSSVMLPLDSSTGFEEVQVLICGGAQAGAYSDLNGMYMGAQQTCGRMTLTDEQPAWTMESMPFRRVMGDMVLLPTKDVLIINGAQNGSAGWGKACVPALHPLVYSPDQDADSRFTIQKNSYIPRMYHSTANLLPDGRVLVAGSNTHQNYTFEGEFPTELRVEAFSPEYLSIKNGWKRPFGVSGPDSVTYGSSFNVTFLALKLEEVEVTMASAPFHTHSYGQGQRLLVVAASEPISEGSAGTYQVTVTAPPHRGVAPPGYYMMFVVNDGIPSYAKWIQVLG